MDWKQVLQGRLSREFLTCMRERGITKFPTSYGKERQTTLSEFMKRGIVKFVYFSFKDKVERRGLSENLIRKRLEKQGWLVWRSALVGIELGENIYPNIRNKYQKLTELLSIRHKDKIDTLRYFSAVHHGMPDFICYRNKTFKFVECKLGHEQLSRRQKLCIIKLQDIGFDIEVHKLAEDCTKMRIANVNLATMQKEVIEKQMRLAKA